MHIDHQYISGLSNSENLFIQRQPWCSLHPFRKIQKNRLVLSCRLTSEWLCGSSSLLLTVLFWRPLVSIILSMQSMKTGWIRRTPCWLPCSLCHKNTYIPRLDAVRLFNLPVDSVEEKVKEKSFQKGLPIEDIKSNTSVSQTFQSEKVYSSPCIFIYFWMLWTQ